MATVINGVIQREVKDSMVFHCDVIGKKAVMVRLEDFGPGRIQCSSERGLKCLGCKYSPHYSPSVLQK